jgi:hypothetical protein
MNSNHATATASGNGTKPPGTAIPVPPEKRCKYRTQRGTPCRAPRRHESEYCIFHDREFRQRRDEYRAAKTVFESRKRPDTAEGVHALLRQTAEAVLRKHISPRIANSVGFLAQMMMQNLDRLRSERRKLVPADHENRLTELVVDQVLDKIEKEIAEAGDDAHPVRAAKLAAEQGRLAAPDGAGSVPELSPDLRESKREKNE